MSMGSYFWVISSSLWMGESTKHYWAKSEKFTLLVFYIVSNHKFKFLIFFYYCMIIKSQKERFLKNFAAIIFVVLCCLCLP